MLESSALESIRKSAEEERRLRESREYHERSKREFAEKIQRLLRDAEAEQLSVVWHSTATIGRVTCVFNLRSFVITATDSPPSRV